MFNGESRSEAIDGHCNSFQLFCVFENGYKILERKCKKKKKEQPEFSVPN